MFLSLLFSIETEFRKTAALVLELFHPHINDFLFPHVMLFNVRLMGATYAIVLSMCSDIKQSICTSSTILLILNSFQEKVCHASELFMFEIFFKSLLILCGKLFHGERKTYLVLSNQLSEIILNGFFSDLRKTFYLYLVATIQKFETGFRNFLQTNPPLFKI